VGKLFSIAFIDPCEGRGRGHRLDSCRIGIGGVVALDCTLGLRHGVKGLSPVAERSLYGWV
jgi:hypothetical protein